MVQNAKETSPILDFLGDPSKHYLTDTDSIEVKRLSKLKPADLVLFRVDEMTYEEKAPRKEALENVLTSTRISGVNFIYLLLGNADGGVKFYYGLSKDDSTEELDLNLAEIGRSVLQASMSGNFRGSRVEEVSPGDKANIVNKISRMTNISRIEGVAGSVKDDEDFQSVDRLVDVMKRISPKRDGEKQADTELLGETFCLMIVAKAIRPDNVAWLERSLYEAYTKLSPMLKYSEQQGSSSSKNLSTTTTEGKNNGTSTSHSETKGTSTSKSHEKSTGKSTQFSSGDSRSSSESGTDTAGENQSKQDTTGTSAGTSSSTAKQDGKTEGVSLTHSREYLDRCAQEWLKYCDDVVFPRLDYGKGKGLFVSACYVMTTSLSAQIKLENAFLSLYSGEKGNRLPLRAFPLSSDDIQVDAAKNFQIPLCRFRENLDENELLARAFLSQCIQRRGWFPLGNWISTNELSMIAGLPRKEVIGMRLREEVEFGLNFDPGDEGDRIDVGCLVQNGNIIKSTSVCLRKSMLDKHIFVAGVTGSGKTTTCQKILIESELPFLVIEPAKTEYRILKNDPSCKGLLIFTLGNDAVAPFRLNPLEFLPGESIISHIDMVKASIEAAFDMEAAIPQLIEATLYRCYQNFGWDVRTGRNSRFADPFAPDVFAFPTLSDLLSTVDEVVKEQGFDARLRDEYIGSIHARLQSLILGDKGLALDTKRSVNFDSLLDKKVVLELEGIRNGNEKSLIIGFVLAALNEAVRERYDRTKRPHRHIILVEEAHRLLSKVVPGDSPNKKQGVETFSDMLAEIRKYGESLIIVDQIPNKLAPDVLKNTNTKIIHRIFAQDDKEAVGSTMALSDEQKNFLSNLAVGRAVIFSDGFEEASQVQVTRRTDTSKAPLSNMDLLLTAMDYYLKENKQNLFFPIRCDLHKLPAERLKPVVDFLRIDPAVHFLGEMVNSHSYNMGDANLIKEMLDTDYVSREELNDWMMERYFKAVPRIAKNEDKLRAIGAALPAFVEECIIGGKDKGDAWLAVKKHTGNS